MGYYLKYFFFCIILFIIMYIVIFFIDLKEESQKKNFYNDLYFETNETNLNLIKDHINENDIIGFIDMTEYRSRSTRSSKLEQYDCYNIEMCTLLSNEIYIKVQEADIKHITSYNGGISFKLYNDFKDEEYNYIYYKKGNFKSRNELDMISGNEMQVIVKIFNEDWGIQSSCYSCGGGGWD